MHVYACMLVYLCVCYIVGSSCCEMFDAVQWQCQVNMHTSCCEMFDAVQWQCQVNMHTPKVGTQSAYSQPLWCLYHGT